MPSNQHILHSRKVILQRVAEVAEEIASEFTGKELDLVYFTNGAAAFAMDLARALTIPSRLHPFTFGTTLEGNSGAVRITNDVEASLQNKHVLLLEGVVISGRTPAYLVDYFSLREPASLAMCAIGSKPALRTFDLPLKYQLFEFGDEWVAGYGVGKGSEKTLANIIDLSQS